jgi:hypothetical protein
MPHLQHVSAMRASRNVGFLIDKKDKTGRGLSCTESDSARPGRFIGIRPAPGGLGFKPPIPPRRDGKEIMRLRFCDGFGAIRIDDAAPENLPAKISVAEALENNRKRWAQFLPAPPPAVANELEASVLRVANAANRRFWEPPTAKTFSEAELRAPSHAAGIKGTAELLADRPEHVKFLTPNNPPDPKVQFLTSEMLALRAMNKRNADFWARHR